MTERAEYDNIIQSTSKGRKMTTAMKKIRTALTLGMLSVAMLAAAQDEPPGARITSWDDFREVVDVVISWIFSILILIAVIFVFVAAFRYLTAQGDPEKVKKANHTLLYAAIAIAVALLAWSVPYLVAAILDIGTDPIDSGP